MNVVISLLTDENWLINRPDGRQAERVATRWRWDASNTTLRLTLRRDVFFHDGTPLTADLAAAILRASVKSNDASSFADVKSVTASGPDSIDIHLSKPDAFLVPDLATVNVRIPSTTDGTAGPFVVASRRNDETVLRAFPRYYRGHPALDEIDVKTYPTQRNAWAALMRREIDMLHEVSRDAAEFVEAESTVKTYSVPRPYYISLVFNVRHPVLKNVKVRQAINESLDRTTLVHDGLNGWGRPADGPVPPDHWAYSPGAPFAFDPDGARALLDAAGYRVKSRTAAEIPSRFNFTCLLYAADSRFEHLATLVQKQLADVGIQMTLLPIKDARELEQRIQKGDFDAFLFEMYGRSLSWAYLFWHSQPHGAAALDTGYHAADAALEHLKAARSDDETKLAVAELARVMHDDPPAAFLAWQTTIRAISAEFDVQPEQGHDIFSNVWQWHLAAPGRQPAR